MPARIELHGPLGMGEQAEQSIAVVQQQVRTLVGREAPGEAQRQNVGVEQPRGGLHLLGRRARCGELPGQAPARVLDECAAAGLPQLPQVHVGDGANLPFQVLRRPQPALLRARLRPQFVRRRRIPGRNVDPVGHVADGHLGRRPAWKEWLEQVSAHLSVQAAHAVHRAAPADGEIGHVEGLRFVVWLLPAQGQQIVGARCRDPAPRTVEGDWLDERRRKPVESRGDRRVGGEEVPRSGDRQRDVERLAGHLHEVPGALQYRESRVAFVQVADFGSIPSARRRRQPPSPRTISCCSRSSGPPPYSSLVIARWDGLFTVSLLSKR